MTEFTYRPTRQRKRQCSGRIRRSCRMIQKKFHQASIFCEFDWEQMSLVVLSMKNASLCSTVVLICVAAERWQEALTGATHPCTSGAPQKDRGDVQQPLLASPSMYASAQMRSREPTPAVLRDVIHVLCMHALSDSMSLMNHTLLKMGLSLPRKLLCICLIAACLHSI